MWWGAERPSAVGSNWLLALGVGWLAKLPEASRLICAVFALRFINLNFLFFFLSFLHVKLRSETPHGPRRGFLGYVVLA